MTLYSQGRWYQQPSSAQVGGEAAVKIGFLPVFCSLSYSVCHANSVMLHFCSTFQQNVWHGALSSALLLGGDVWLYQLSIHRVSIFCARAGIALAACKCLCLASHAKTAGNFAKQSVFPKLLRPFCPLLSSSIRMAGRKTLRVANPTWAIT